MKEKKIALFSLGCKVNQAEIENLIRVLAAYEFKKVSEKADICIINTCTVTNIADQKSRQKIRRVIKDNPGAFIIVTGCYAQTAREDIEKIPGVNLVLKNPEKESLADIIREKFSIRKNKPDTPSEFIPQGRTRAFLKIQEGCNNYCSYCIIPYVRGKPKSLPVEEVVRRANNLHRSGYKEIVITGINLGAYGKDLTQALTLSGLLKRILENIDIERLRISSIEPLDIDNSLLELMKDYPVFCRHLHIPLQHGHDEILHSMNRHYSTEKYTEIVNLTRKKISDLSVTTDVMVGFPGEKEEHFKATKKLIEELNFSKLHVFCYSQREGTRASKFSGQIDEKTKKERSRILLETGEKLTEKFYKNFIGRIMPVLFEHRPDKKTGLLKGLTGNYIPVTAEGEQNHLGQILPVTILDFKEKALLGKITGREKRELISPEQEES